MLRDSTEMAFLFRCPPLGERRTPVNGEERCNQVCKWSDDDKNGVFNDQIVHVEQTHTLHVIGNADSRTAGSGSLSARKKRLSRTHARRFFMSHSCQIDDLSAVIQRRKKKIEFLAYLRVPACRSLITRELRHGACSS